jgi:hypothetical protein
LLGTSTIHVPAAVSYLQGFLNKSQTQLFWAGKAALHKFHKEFFQHYYNGSPASIMNDEMGDEATTQHQDSKRNADSDSGSHPAVQKRRKKDLGRKGWRLFKPLPVA